MTLTLYGRPGWGSVLIEAQLACYGLDHDMVDCGELFDDAAARARLARVNPLAQVPALILEDGALMTESAAITLHLADRTGRDDLVPGPASPTRPAFLRWLVFHVANLYPVFTYADQPSRFVEAPDCQADFQARVMAHAERLQSMVEDAAASPWFLGDRFSALDIYIATFWHWDKPHTDWFRTHAPRLTAIAERARALPELEAVWARNFPKAS